VDDVYVKKSAPKNRRHYSGYLRRGKVRKLEKRERRPESYSDVAEKSPTLSVSYKKRRAYRYARGPLTDNGDGSFSCTLYDNLEGKDVKLQLEQCSEKQAEEEVRKRLRQLNEQPQEAL